MSDERNLIAEARRYIEEDAPDEDYGTDLLAQVTDALEAGFSRRALAGSPDAGTSEAAASPEGEDE